MLLVLHMPLKLLKTSKACTLQDLWRSSVVPDTKMLDVNKLLKFCKLRDGATMDQTFPAPVHGLSPVGSFFTTASKERYMNCVFLETHWPWCLAMTTVTLHLSISLTSNMLKMRTKWSPDVCCYYKIINNHFICVDHHHISQQCYFTILPSGHLSLQGPQSFGWLWVIWFVVI